MAACGTCLLCKLTSAGAGGVVDVTECGNERVIKADCVVAAIRAPAGLQLTGAEIAGPLCLDFETVGGPLALLGCEFKGFQANNATFKNVVKLNKSSFTNLDFLGSVFERVLMLDDATVRGPLSLWSTRLQSGLAARGLTVHGRVRAREMSVASSADFSCARFSRGVTFERAHVGQALFLRRASFASRVSFNGADAAHIDARGSSFARGVGVRGTRIAGTLRLDHARFHGATDFDECQARDITARSVRFDGLVTFRSAGVSAQLTIEDTTFSGGLHIEGLHAGGWRLAGTKFVRGGVVPGEVDATALALASGSLIAEDLDVSGDATFERLDVAGELTMTGGRFGNDLLFRDVACRSMDLSGAGVAGRLQFEGVKPERCIGPDDAKPDVFKLENVSVSQDVALRVRVLGNVKLRGLIVQGWLDLRGLQVERGGQPVQQGLPATSASLRAQFLNVGRDVDCDATTRIADELDLTGAKVNGALKLPASGLPPKVALNSASLGALVMDARDGVSPTTRIDMVNCSYGRLEGDHRWLLERQPVRQPHDIPNRQPFLAVERNLRTSGRDADADEVYFIGRRRTRWQSPWIQDVPQAVLSGYGVKPYRVANAIVIVWFCAFMFFLLTSGAVRNTTPEVRRIGVTDKFKTVEEWTHQCANDRATFLQAMIMPLQIFLPSSFGDADIAVVQSCPVTVELPRPLRVTVNPIVTVIVVFLLKLGGLTLIPLGIAIMTGLIRPAARA